MDRKTKTLLYSFLFFAFFIGLSPLRAQTPVRDVIYLKSGEIIRGVIIELDMNKTLKIKSNGIVYQYDVSAIKKIEKEGINLDSIDAQLPKFPTHYITIYGMLVIPTGDFAQDNSEAAGLAQTGYGFGLEYNSFSPSSFYFSTGASLYINPVNTDNLSNQIKNTLSGAYRVQSVSLENAAYYQFSGVLGLGLHHTSSPRLRSYAQILLGVMGCSIPEMNGKATINDYYSSSQYTSVNKVKIESKSDVTLAYGAKVGINTGNISVNLRYLYATPKFDNVERTTGMFSVELGVNF